MGSLGYSRFLPYAIGRFDGHHTAPLFATDHTELSPLGGEHEYLRANKRDLSGVYDRISAADRFAHDAYGIAGHEPHLADDTCPYCRAKIWLEVRELADEGQFFRSPIPESVLRSKAAIIFDCPGCGWWRLIIHFKEGICNDWDHTLWFTNFIYDGVVCDFPTGHARLITELRTQIRRRAIDLRNVSPQNLERLVGAVFRDYLGVPVRHVGGPGDGGIDLIVSDADAPIAIQVKRRSRVDSVESVAEVRHLLGSMVLGGFRRGVLATTADHFSEDARKAAEVGRRRSVFIELYDHERLSELIQRTPPAANPWESILALLHPAQNLWAPENDEGEQAHNDGSIFLQNDPRVARHPMIARWLEKMLGWLR